MTEGERIKLLRSELSKTGEKMTLEKFGSKLGVGKSAISDIERGRNSLSDQMAKAICREFNVREEWLRTGEGEMFVQLDVEDELTQWAEKVFSGENVDFRKRFVRLLSKLNDSAWVKLEEYARMLVGNTETDQDDEERAVEEFWRQYRLEKEAGEGSEALNGTKGKMA